MKRMKTKFQRFLLALLLLNLRLNDSLAIGGEVVHIKLHIPRNAVPFGPPNVMHHTYENHIRRQNPSSSGSVLKQPLQYRTSHTEKPTNFYVDSHGEIDEPKTQESMHTYEAVDRMGPKIYHHDEPYDEAYNYRTSPDGYYSHFKDRDYIYISANQQPAQPIRTSDPDDRDYDQEPSHYGNQSPPRDFERDLSVHDSYMSDSRYPYGYNTPNSAVKVIEPQLSHHYSKHYGNRHIMRPHRKSRNPYNSIRHQNHKYNYEDRRNNKPLTMDRLAYDSFKPMKIHYKPMTDEYSNQESMDVISGYHPHHTRAPPKYVKLTANGSYQPPSRYRRPAPHSSFKSSEPYNSNRAKHTRGLGLQGYEYSASYPWM